MSERTRPARGGDACLERALGASTIPRARAPGRALEQGFQRVGLHGRLRRLAGLEHVGERPQLERPRRLRGRSVDGDAQLREGTRGVRGLVATQQRAQAQQLRLEDGIRNESRQAIDGLHAAGIEVAMVTGDAANVASAVARDLGIDEVFAEVLPEHKFEQVEDLQRRGRRVAMVGDGVNDAPALARADVGIAIGAGTDVAIESAGVVLASDDPRGVLAVTRLSRASYRKMVQNLGWAVGYNVIAIPLAAGVLAFQGVVLPPALGALMMSLSTVIVALNAQLIRRLDLSPA